ncbi:MAG: hypothetical protein ABSF59_17745 [Candidatus Sulfotelmatobacter sp.]|jgi:hypothetical protein
MLKELVEGVSWSPPGNASDDHFSPEFGLELANLLFALSSFVVPSPGTLPPMPGKHKFEDQLAALDALRQQPPEACITCVGS